MSTCCVVAGAVVAVKRHSKLEAAAAARRAKPWRPVLGPQSASSDVDPQAICGANSLVADNSLSNCRIVTTYGNGAAFTCSAFKFADRLLGTAGELCDAVCL